MSKGRGIAFTGRGKIELVELNVPEIRPDEVLVASELTAVSQGTDRAMVAGSYGGVDDRYPFIYGYSRVGRIVEVGAEVTGAAVGDRVFVGMAGTRLDPADGFGEQGGSYTSHGVVHHTEVVRLPDGASSTTAAIGAIAAIAYQGVVSSNVQPGSRVLVAGLGAVGQFSALFSKLRGGQVWGSDPVASRRELAARISGAIPLDPSDDLAASIETTAWGTRPWRGRNSTPSSKYEQGRWAHVSGPLDVVIDATGRSDAIEAYLPLLAREGCLCLQGYYANPLTLDFHAAHLKRLTIRCPGGMDFIDYEKVLTLMSIVEVSELVGLEIPVDEAPASLQDLLFQSPGTVAATIRWRAEEAGVSSKVVSLAEAISLIADGTTVALGGHTLRRHPMAAVAEIVRTRKRDLHILGWNSGVDVDLLVGAGCAAIVETSFVGISGFGLARNYRRAAEAGAIEIREHSEISALDMFRAGSMGVPFMASSVLRGSDVPATNPRIAEVTSPFDDRVYTAVGAAQPDVAIIHAHSADLHGNVQLDAAHWPDNDADVFIGWAGKTTIVTVEQLVSDEEIRRSPDRTILPRDAVTCVVEAPYGAYPCACDSRYTYDLDWIGDYYAASADADAFAAFVDRWVHGPGSHEGFLELVGLDRLLGVASHGGVL